MEQKNSTNVTKKLIQKYPKKTKQRRRKKLNKYACTKKTQQMCKKLNKCDKKTHQIVHTKETQQM